MEKGSVTGSSAGPRPTAFASARIVSFATLTSEDGKTSFQARFSFHLKH